MFVWALFGVKKKGHSLVLDGNTWVLESLDTETRHSSALRREDNIRIQVVVNKVLRIV